MSGKGMRRSKPAAFSGDAPVPQAAVALVLRPGPDPALLLVRRAPSPRDPWSGQMALPGGRRDAEDSGLQETAIRETREETGVDLDRSGVLAGRLPDLKPVSRAIPRLVISPFVFRLSGPVEAWAASPEIAAVYWVPVAALTSSARRSTVTIDTPTGRRTFPCFRVAGHPVWGLTFRILESFLEAGPDMGEASPGGILEVESPEARGPVGGGFRDRPDTSENPEG